MDLYRPDAGRLDRWVAATRPRRLGFALLMLAVGLFVLVNFALDPVGYITDGGGAYHYPALIAAPIVVFIAGRAALRNLTGKQPRTRTGDGQWQSRPTS
jgi:hypothetical protein